MGLPVWAPAVSFRPCRSLSRAPRQGDHASGHSKGRPCRSLPLEPQWCCRAARHAPWHEVMVRPPSCGAKRRRERVRLTRRATRVVDISCVVYGSSSRCLVAYAECRCRPVSPEVYGNSTFFLACTQSRATPSVDCPCFVRDVCLCRRVEKERCVTLRRDHSRVQMRSSSSLCHTYSSLAQGQQD